MRWSSRSVIGSRDTTLVGFIETTIRRSGAELTVLDEQDVSPIARCVTQMVLIPLNEENAGFAAQTLSGIW